MLLLRRIESMKMVSGETACRKRGLPGMSITLDDLRQLIREARRLGKQTRKHRNWGAAGSRPHDSWP